MTISKMNKNMTKKTASCTLFQKKRKESEEKHQKKTPKKGVEQRLVCTVACTCISFCNLWNWPKNVVSSFQPPGGRVFLSAQSPKKKSQKGKICQKMQKEHEFSILSLCKKANYAKNAIFQGFGLFKFCNVHIPPLTSTAFPQTRQHQSKQLCFLDL